MELNQCAYGISKQTLNLAKDCWQITEFHGGTSTTSSFSRSPTHISSQQL